MFFVALKNNGFLGVELAPRQWHIFAMNTETIN